MTILTFGATNFKIAVAVKDLEKFQILLNVKALNFYTIIEHNSRGSISYDF